MKKWYNLAFLAVCLAVFLVLWAAPPEKTARLPADANHENRREYARCPACHGPGSKAPMPADHYVQAGIPRADHLKCYMCHKPSKR